MFNRGLCRVAVFAPLGYLAFLVPGLLGLLILSLAALDMDEDEPEPDTASARDFRLLPAEGGHQQVCLSDREREVLMMVSSGRSVDEIASALFLSPATIKTHLQRIYRRLDVSDRAAAVAKAIRDGLID